ncbi:hypothetical protein REPUB_Repub08aG0137000 [Reevesia pubescens]
MPIGKLALPAVTALILFTFLDTGIARREGKPCFSSCGTINISSPFRLKDDPRRCGDPLHELACENDSATYATKYGKFYVKEISYDRYSIRLVDENVVDKGKKCSIPRNSLLLGCDRSQGIVFDSQAYYENIYFLNCKEPINSSFYDGARIVDASPCTNTSSFPYPYIYALISSIDGKLKFSDLSESCKVEVQVPHQYRFLNVSSMSIFDICKELSIGIEVSWSTCTSWHPSIINK